MKRPLSILAISAMLTGCLEYTPMYKVGATTQETNVTRAQCNTFAANTVPVIIVRDWIPIFGANGRVVGGYYETYDANEGRRFSVQRQCMEQQGYERVSIPYCKEEQIAGRGYKPLTTSPPIGPSICAVKQDGGGRVLIDLNQPAS
ncbi:hypothetical protein [uncultured Shimia sp.]|uniref:hypothetical protein n=1 Tax=uncultured Shimia sp. TaxID=573152 RepID=UPI0026020E50|nr:hypothetical protein [uncultured Shimia sp.]